MRLRKRSWFFAVDWVLVLLTGAISIIGVYNLASATHNTGNLLQNHILFLVLGTIGAIAISFIETRFLEAISYPVFVVVLFLLLLVPIIGTTRHGATRWLELGFSLQPSELAKISTILALSRFLADRPRSSEGYNLFDLLLASCIIGPPVLFIFFQPDLGTSILLASIAFSIIIIAGVRGEALFTYFAVVLLAVPILWVTGLIQNYQKTRIITFLRLPGEIALLELYGGILLIFLALAAIMFGVRAYQRNKGAFVGCLMLSAVLGVGSTALLDAFYDQREEAIAQEGPAQERARKLREMKEEYQPRQSEIAIGSGGMYGKGYFTGSQTQLGFLPIAWTDYIFSVFSEEHGFAGSMVLMGLYMCLVLWSLRLSVAMRDRFSAYLAIGCGAFFLWHMLINIGMVTRMLPVVGVTLPLLSSGGSSLLASMTALGLLANVSARRSAPSSTFY
jgi:rod shape determining protein RodA